MSPSEVARKYLGQTEKPANSGFNDTVFQDKMEEVGFQKGHAWCAYFAELVFKEAIPERYDELDKLFSGSTILTFRNFQDAAFPIGQVPRVDSLVIWQTVKEGKKMATGHAGIVSEVMSTWEFKSIEGNTAGGGSREGWIVAEHSRKVLASVANGLKVLGFIHIPKISTLTI
jgi:hypothetical protein